MSFNTEDFLKKDDETNIDYTIRCYKQKHESELSWQTVAEIMNEQLGNNYSESYYRKQSKKYEYNELSDEDKLANDLKELILEFKKTKVKLSDERIQNNAYIRQMAREDTIKEIAFEYAKKMNAKKLLCDTNRPIYTSDKEAILMISDWHYGLSVNNYVNTYNTDICKQRVSKLLEETKEILFKEHITTLHLVNLSDLICGRIHMGLRLQSRIDVITQTMDISEILAEFISNLSESVVVKYMDVLDNHSRLEPNKSESLELESLVRMIPWYLKERLKGNENVEFPVNYNDPDIITFEVLGHKVAAVHGHKDKPTKVIDNMVAMTGRLNDLVLTAHLHHFASEEEHECVRISNGSLMGTDDYAKDLRLTSKPSQTLIICTPDNVTKCIYKINLE